ncbi:MAG: glycosyltransferase family 2 protein [Planctomycetota bacterium]|nr:glycosyltransferase family 2 protein [Planctomycetota bacterium]
MAPALSIVIPCYNEAGNIPLILERLRAAVGSRRDVEVLLVNNGSKDNSTAVFSSELAKPGHEFARVVVVEVNQGYGFGILSGLRAAQGQFLAWTHADMQTDPTDVLLGFDQLLKQPQPEQCFLRGRRKARPPLDAFFTFGMSIVGSLALGVWLHDINAQPKILHRSFFATWIDPPRDFSLDLYALYTAKRAGLTILSRPVFFTKRIHGEAKGGGTLKGKWKLVKRTFAYIAKLRRELKRSN